VLDGARQRLVILVCVLLLVVGLIVFLALRDGEDDSDEPPGPNSWTALQERIYRAGGPTPELALEAFATIFGPLPGVEVGDVRLPPHMSGTGAVRLVQGFSDSFTPAQRAAIRRVLFEPLNRSPWRVSRPQTVPRDARSVHVPNRARSAPGGARPRLVARVGGTRKPGPKFALNRSPGDGNVVLAQSLRELRARGQTVMANLAGLLRRPLRHPVVWFSPDPELDRRFGFGAADSWAALGRRVNGAWLPAGTEDGWCVIKIGAHPMREGGPELESVMAHELFHCYEYEVNRHLTDRGPSWLTEGSAEWVGESYAGPLGSNLSRVSWADYNSTRSLFARSYDAIGFYAHMAQVGIDPWKRLIPMLRMGSSASAFSRAAAGDDGRYLLDTWPMSWSNLRDFGREWVLDGPGAGDPGSKPFHLVDTGAGGRVRVQAGRGEQRLWGIDVAAIRAADPEADLILTVDVTGYGALRWGPAEANTDRFGGRFSATYCLAGTCTCPGGGPPGLRRGPFRENWWPLPLTGTLEPAQAIIAARSLDEVCSESPSAGFDSCLGRWRLVRLAHPRHVNLSRGLSATATVSGGTGTELTISPPRRQRPPYIGSARVDFTDTRPLNIVSREREEFPGRSFTRSSFYRGSATGVAHVDIWQTGEGTSTIQFSPIVPTHASGRRVSGHWETRTRWVEVVDLGDHLERDSGGGRNEGGGPHKLFPAPSPYPVGAVRYTCKERSLTLKQPRYEPCLGCLRWEFTRVTPDRGRRHAQGRARRNRSGSQRGPKPDEHRHRQAGQRLGHPRARRRRRRLRR
jgi:hypothetical protein